MTRKHPPRPPRRPAPGPSARFSPQPTGKPRPAPAPAATATRPDRPPPRPRSAHGPEPGPGTKPGQGPGSGPEDDRAGPWIYGLHAALAAIANPEREVLRILVASEQMHPLAARLAARAAESGIARPAPEGVPRETLERALPRGAVHQGIAVQTAPLEPLDLDDLIRRLDGRARARVLVLDQVTDPHNVGAILRSAAAFGADAVILPERHAPAASATMAKAASGAMETVDLVRVVNLARALDALKEAQIWCVGLTGDAAQSLDSADLTGRVALVLGSEGDGLRRLTRERCDLLVRIPMAPNAVGSLNVSNAAAIALYAASRGGSETG
jgi:23S rRNA (guanosine2251-2'-O)-methyltransferase